jgi:hypothetical protein
MRIVWVLALVGCAAEQSSGPALNTYAMARHLDSLYVAVRASGDTLRANLVTAVEIPLAFGAPSTPVYVDVDTLEPQGLYDLNTVVWPAVGYALIDTTRADTMFVVAIYEYTDASTLLLVQRSGATASAALFAGDTVDFSPEHIAVHVTAGGTGGLCHLGIAAQNPAVASLSAATCRTLMINSSDTLTTAFGIIEQIAGIWFTGATTVTGVEFSK